MTQRIAAGLMLIAFLGSAQQTAQKQVKNQQEYDLYNAARNEQEPGKKLLAIDAWKAKFPDTELKEDRNLFYLSAYLALQTAALKSDANALAAAQGAKAAHTVIDNLDSIFASSIQPGYIKNSDWAAARQQATLQSHWTLANLAMNRKDTAATEAEAQAVLKILPNDPNAALLFSCAIVAEGKQQRYPEAIFQVARALGEVPDVQRKALSDRLEKMYQGYHGELAGLEQVKAAAALSPFPPANWTIQSVTEISQAQIAAEEKFNNDHPEIVLWRVLRDKLTAAGAEAYFEMELKNIELPPLKAKILGQTSPRELTVLMNMFLRRGRPGWLTQRLN